LQGSARGQGQREQKAAETEAEAERTVGQSAMQADNDRQPAN
jgi:hypothetical protein